MLWEKLGAKGGFDVKYPEVLTIKASGYRSGQLTEVTLEASHTDLEHSKFVAREIEHYRNKGFTVNVTRISDSVAINRKESLKNRKKK